LGAAGATDDWWWPVGIGRTYWPDGVQRLVTLDAFREAFATLGFAACTSHGLEPGVEKIALFADPQGKPTHAARQLPSGEWTSKLGRREDIEHALHDLEGTLYGSVALIMARPQQTGEVSPTNP
jgi:hypothetical protein